MKWNLPMAIDAIASKRDIKRFVRQYMRYKRFLCTTHEAIVYALSDIGTV